MTSLSEPYSDRNLGKRTEALQEFFKRHPAAARRLFLLFYTYPFVLRRDEDLLTLDKTVLDDVVKLLRLYVLEFRGPEAVALSDSMIPVARELLS